MKLRPDDMYDYVGFAHPFFYTFFADSAVDYI